MRVFVTGATGAIGRPLVAHLAASGHQVIGKTRSERGRALLNERGATPLILDVLNADSVREAIDRVQPDVVIDQLTSLPKSYSTQAMQAAFELHRRVRLEGGANVQSAAQEAGARRYIVQSGAFVFAPGEGLSDENAALAIDAPPGIAATALMLADVEQRAHPATNMEVVILRYGAF